MIVQPSYDRKWLGRFSWQYRLLVGYFSVQKAFTSSGARADYRKERSELEKLGAMFKPLASIETTEDNADGVPVEWIASPASSPARTVFFIHGGSYVSGSISSYRSLGANIGHASGARTLMVDYRLAPEHPYPAAIEDAAKAYMWLIEKHISADKVVVAGDSSGGGLALALAVYLRDRSLPLPAAVVSLSPMTDMLMSGDTWTTNSKSDVVIYPHKEREFARMYLGGADPLMPYASPIYADMKGLPPVCIQVGTNEVLLSDSTRLAEKARKAGVDVTLEEWEGMQHDWHFTASLVPEGREAIVRLGDFIRERT